MGFTSAKAVDEGGSSDDNDDDDDDDVEGLYEVYFKCPVVVMLQDSH